MEQDDQDKLIFPNGYFKEKINDNYVLLCFFFLNYY